MFFLFLSCSKQVIIPEFDQSSSIYNDVEYLASDELEGRNTGTKGEQLAAEYISKRLAEMGVSPKGDDNGYYQFFKAKDPDANNPHSMGSLSDDGRITGRNVIGYIDNQAKNTIVIGGHYDHLGMGEFGSLHAGGAAIHNGADDNASGVAVVLALAERLTKHVDSENNYLFIFFSGEERGLWGSNYFTQNPTIDLTSVNYMINYDMVGRLKEDRSLAVNGTGTSPKWMNALNKANSYQFKLIPSESGFGPSDHSQFYTEDIPVLHFFTGQHKDYHKPSDDVELVNFKGVEDITDYSHDLIYILNKEGKLKFTKTNDQTQDTPSFKVTLGVMPDYLYDGSGMRIDGVKEGRPAFKADMQNGDVVIKMGELEIVDMMSYMKALGEFEPGQTVNVTVLRDGKELIKKVTF